MQLPQNQYPNYTNFQAVSFPEEVTPPDVDPDVDVMCVRYNPAWSQVLAAACDQLTQLSAWAGDDDAKKLAVNRATNLKVLLQEFKECCDMCCCNPPPLSRITPSGVYEQSVDGGVTWTPAPGADPRNQATALPPQVGTDSHDVRCKTANSIVWFLQHAQTEYYNQLLAGAGITDLIAAGLALLALIGIIGTGGAFAPLFLAIASLIVSVDAATFASFFNSAGWEAFTCKVYCDIDSNGKVRAGKFQDIADSAVTVFGSNQGGKWLQQFITTMGIGGLENAGAVTSTNSVDCSGCDCAECPYDAVLTAACPGPGMTIVEGACVAGEGIAVNHPRPPFGDFFVQVVIEFEEPCNAGYYHVTADFPAPQHANNQWWFDYAVARDSSGNLIWIDGSGAQFGFPSGVTTVGAILAPTGGAQRLAVRLNGWDGGYQLGTVRITRIKFDDTPP